VLNGEEARRIVKAVREVLSGAPAPEGTALQEGVFPPAWGGWLLLCLMRQLTRQRWLLAMVKERLSGDQVPEEGDIPGYGGWRYLFHGSGCCFTGPGETLDVDFHGDEGATIDPYFFGERILTLASPELPEARLAALLPGSSLIDAALQELRAWGLLVHPDSPHVFRLAPELEALAEAAAALELSGEAARERCLAHLGDFEALGPLPGGDVSRSRVEEARGARRDWLLALAHRPRTAGEALRALESLQAPDERVRACERILDEEPVSAATARAVEQLDVMPGAAGREAVLRLLGRLVPAEHHPYPMCATARYLLRRGIERERAVAAMLAFARVDVVRGYGGNPFVADFALLALESVHEHALELVRRALRSTVPMARQTMAAVLLLLDRPWCQRELAAALRESDREGGAVFLALALSRSSSDWAHAVAARWRRENPPGPESGPGYTWEEVEEAHSDTWFESELEDARAWVERAGSRVPEEGPG
jgi:hypothetical protein